MSKDIGLPRGGIDFRKYAAISLALALARGALINASTGTDREDMLHILDLTATSKIAEALDCTESDLAINWHEYLTPSEVDRIKGW